MNLIRSFAFRSWLQTQLLSQFLIQSQLQSQFLILFHEFLQFARGGFLGGGSMALCGRPH